MLLPLCLSDHGTENSSKKISYSPVIFLRVCLECQIPHKPFSFLPFLKGCLTLLCVFEHGCAGESGTGVTEHFRLPRGCWELNCAPLQEQKALLPLSHLSPAL